MDRGQGGFTLIEAMISVVILSTGLLALAQLQARLWSASGDLHASAQAYLLADDTLERAVIGQVMAVDPAVTSSEAMTSSATEFAVSLAVVKRAQVTETSVRVGWENPGGAHSLTLACAIYAKARLSDTRLLLTRISHQAAQELQ